MDTRARLMVPVWDKERKKTCQDQIVGELEIYLTPFRQIILLVLVRLMTMIPILHQESTVFLVMGAYAAEMA